MITLLTNKKLLTFYSFLIKIIFKCYGIKVGNNFYIEGIPKLKILGKRDNILIGNNVNIMGNIDLRNRENGKIIIKDNVTIDENVRFVASNEGIIEIGDNSFIGPNTIINGGGNVVIGKKTVFAKNISINANDHNHAKSAYIRDQGYSIADVTIEDDVWLGANVCINKGVIVRQGSVVGANAVVTKNTEPYSINVGVPAKKITERA